MRGIVFNGLYFFVIFVTFCANDSWCFPLSLLARIQIDIAELAVLQKKTKKI